MGKDIKGKELGVGISQRSDGFYVGRFTTKYGQRKQELFRKLQECRQWLADSQYQDEHSNLNFPEALTLEQQKRFVRGIVGNAYEYQYKFLLQTRLRTGELVGLRWADVDFDNRTLLISRSMEYRHSTGEWRVGEPKSKSGYRSIPLTEEAIDMLRKQRQKILEVKVIPMEWSEYVFLCRKGTPVKNSTYDTMLFKQCDKIGIPRFSMHVLRYTFATRCIEGGMKPKTLQSILGHFNIGITMNLYVHTTEDEKHKEIEKIAAFLKAVLEKLVRKLVHNQDLERREPYKI